MVILFQFTPSTSTIKMRPKFNVHIVMLGVWKFPVRCVLDTRQPAKNIIAMTVVHAYTASKRLMKD